MSKEERTLMEESKRKRGRPRKNPLPEGEPAHRMPPKLLQYPIEVDVKSNLRSYRVTAYTTLPENREETEPDIQDEILTTSGTDAVQQMMKDHGLARYFHVTCADVTPAVPRKRRTREEMADDEATE